MPFIHIRGLSVAFQRCVVNLGPTYVTKIRSTSCSPTQAGRLFRPLGYIFDPCLRYSLYLLQRSGVFNDPMKTVGQQFKSRAPRNCRLIENV